MPIIRKSNRLRELRQAQGLSGYDLQVLTKINAQRVYFIERGIVRPNRAERVRISAALKLAEEQVFPREMQLSSEIEWV
jgi:transcriptional regulator with XRE-family HTH domain